MYIPYNKKKLCLLVLLFSTYISSIQRIIYFLASQTVELWRYEDPVLGDCKIPTFNNPTHGKVLIPSDAIFIVDLEQKKVSVSAGGKAFDIGKTIAYLVSSPVA